MSSRELGAEKETRQGRSKFKLQNEKNENTRKSDMMKEKRLESGQWSSERDFEFWEENNASQASSWIAEHQQLFCSYQKRFFCNVSNKVIIVQLLETHAK